MNQRTIKKRSLGEPGVDFVRQQLSDGGPLSERFLERLSGGQVWEFYYEDRPVATKPDELGHGGQFDADDCAAQGEGYVDFLVNYLNGGPRILLSENQLARMSDPFMLNRTNLFEFEGTTYFYYPPRESCNADQSGVADAMTSASSYPRIVFATHASSASKPPQRGVVSKDLANEFGDQTEHLLVGAYDGEGYVVWSAGA